MTSPTDQHYATLLAPVYTWMSGGTEQAFDQGRADLEPILPSGSLAVDLGAGFGAHTIPLARMGWRVIAVDSSPRLLGELTAAAQGLAVTAHCGDLLSFPDYLAGSDRPDLVLCMGDTLTHLADIETVADLGRKVAACLSPQGRFVATFRDYSRLPTGTGRFIPVRADEQRILTCFLEDCGDHVAVHDILHERDGGTWRTTVGSYRKLRVTNDLLIATLGAAGLRATIAPAPRGILRLVAHV